MSQPTVNMTELDGALGVLPATSGKLYAVVGPAIAGPMNTPATFGRPKDIVSNFTGGPAAEAACHELEVYGKPVTFVRTNTTTAGAPGTPDLTGVVGTSVITATGTPNDDYEAQLKVILGGTIGTGPIAFQWSLDGGRNWSPITSLGTAVLFAIPGSGLTLNFAAGTLVTGDVVKTRTVAPQWSATELGAALDALQNSAVNWEIVHIVGPIDATAFDTIETKMAAIRIIGKYCAWIGNTRMPLVAETEATYLSSLSGVFGSKVSVVGTLCAGACKLVSSVVSGRVYKRPISFSVAADTASASPEVDIADINRGALTGVSIRDANGNPDEHDESINPGLDDARFCTLRTWDGEPGVFVNRPRLFSGPTSDFQIMPHRRVLNIAEAVLKAYFIRRLNKPILVDKTTGFIKESSALEIEAGATAALAAALGAVPMASGWLVVISRTDNLLSTKTLTGDARVIPLAYPEIVNLSVGFSNPALQLQAA